MPSPLEMLESRLTFLDDPQWESRDKVEKGLLIVRDVSNATLACYQMLRGQPVQQAELGQAIKDFYAKRIAPIDLPGIGPVVEGIIDSYLPGLLAGLVPQIDLKLDTILPNPVPPA